MADDLRAKIAEAIEDPIRDCLADHDSFDRNDNLRDACTTAALAAIAEWLADQSAAMSEVVYAGEPIAHTLRLVKAEAIANLARSLTQPSTEESRDA